MMPQKAHIYRILIASPSDCSDERKAVLDTVRDWNASYSLERGDILEPVLWEHHSRPQLGDRPQGIINSQLVAVCDMLVGIFWTRLGSPTGRAASGTVEEIEQFREAGREVLLYFSNRPISPDKIDSAQAGAVASYRQQLGDDGLYSVFNDSVDFRQQFSRHLGKLMAETLPFANTHEAPRLSALPSECGLDYRYLDYLLSSERWEQANEETKMLLLRASGRESFGPLDNPSNRGTLGDRDIDNLPGTDLLTIDILWTKHSQGRFGFSVQARILEEESDWHRFCRRVGWVGQELMYAHHAPPGHLPTSPPHYAVREAWNECVILRKFARLRKESAASAYE